MGTTYFMSNEELDKAIDTAARHSVTSDAMLEHLKKLLEVQIRRATEVYIIDAGQISNFSDNQ